MGLEGGQLQTAMKDNFRHMETNSWNQQSSTPVADVSE